MRYILSTLGLYRRLLSIRIRAQLQYRASRLFELAAVFLSTATSFASLALVLERFDGIAGWTLGEVAFLYGMVETSFGIVNAFCSGFDPDIFGPAMVQRGGFDQLLLRPASVTLQVLGSDFALRHLSRIVQGLVVFSIALTWIDVPWTPAKIAYLPLVSLSLVCFFSGLFIIGSTSTFWTVQRVEVINIFTYGGSEMMAYPMHIYAKWMRRFFTYVVPAIFLNYYPALYFLGKPDPLHMPSFAPFLSPVVGLGILALALAFWHVGVRHYAGTGT